MRLQAAFCSIKIKDIRKGTDMTDLSKIKAGGILRTTVLLILGVLYLALVAAMFIFNIDLAADKTMQAVLHITVILSAFAYLFFVDMIYGTETDKGNGRLALILAALFTVPILIGRGIGIAVISFNELFAVDSIFNFYAAVSITRTIELISWTTFFPLSMLFLAKLFFKKGKKTLCLAWLCLFSSICCFIAFMSIISTNMIYLFIGVTGWGILFSLIIIVYLSAQIRKIKDNRAGS